MKLRHAIVLTVLLAIGISGCIAPAPEEPSPLPVLGEEPGVGSPAADANPALPSVAGPPRPEIAVRPLPGESGIPPAAGNAGVGDESAGGQPGIPAMPTNIPAGPPSAFTGGGSSPSGSGGTGGSSPAGDGLSGPAVAQTFTVNSADDTGDANIGDGVCDAGSGVCTLRAAIQESNATADRDMITFASAYTITLTADLPAVTEDIDIIGPAELSGGQIFRSGFSFQGGITATVDRMTFRSGKKIYGGAIETGVSGPTENSITIRNSTFDQNGGGPWPEGGSIYNYADGGGTSTLTIENSTISASNIYSYAINGAANTYLTHVTLPVSGRAITVEADSGQVATLTYTNSLLGDCWMQGPGTTTTVDGGGNLIYRPVSPPGNCTGTDDPDAFLGLDSVLRENGGPTRTHAIYPGSPAIDNGVPEACLPTDQRGLPRPFGSSCDSGAVELTQLTFVVNSTGDAVDVNLGDGICETATPGECTLRAAMQEANINRGATDSIIFDIPDATDLPPHTIQPTSALPILTDAVVIDGTTEPDYVDHPVVEVEGSLAGTAHGLYIEADCCTVQDLPFFGGNSTVRGLAIHSFQGTTCPVYSDCAAILLAWGGNNVIEGNFLGTDVTGTIAHSNTSGLVVYQSTNNVVGGTTLAQRNLISGNGIGIGIYGSSASDNVIQGNYIGSDVNGASPIANSTGIVLSGYWYAGMALSNTIGGSTPGAGNLISGNTYDGIYLAGTQNDVQGNLIGTDITGTVALGNGDYGINVHLSDSAHLIGGTDVGAGNVISGNGDAGIHISNYGYQLYVQGNFIGTDVTGTVAIPNYIGVEAEFGGLGYPVTLGGEQPGAGNLISGNTIAGVVLKSNSPSSFGAWVQGNRIGTDFTGTQPLGNGKYGIYLVGHDNSVIGGPYPGQGNVIAHHSVDGIRVAAWKRTWGTDGGEGNRILGNSIFDNGGSGIDLYRLEDEVLYQDNPYPYLGPTPNDVGDGDSDFDGGNRLQNYPVLTAAASGWSETAVTGTLNSEPNMGYHLEFFANASCDPSGYGEGETYLGYTDVITDGSGNVTFAVNLAASVPVGHFISATATHQGGWPGGNTSEFSACQPVVEGPLADLRLRVGGPGEVRRGGSASFTLKVTNDGPMGIGDGAVLTGAMPGVAFTNATCNPGPCVTVNFPDPASFSVTLGSIPAGQTVTVTLDAAIDDGLPDTLTLDAQVNPPGGATDPDLTDNADSFTTQAVISPEGTTKGIRIGPLDYTLGGGGPYEIALTIEGATPSSCQKKTTVTQARSGADVYVEVAVNDPPKGKVCAPSEQPFTITVLLDWSFSGGQTITLHVNGKVIDITLP